MALIKCPECGNMVSDKASACPKCGRPVGIPLTCPECGELITSNAQFCDNCGCPVHKDVLGNPEGEWQEDGTDKKRRWLWVLIALLSCLLAAGVYYVHSTRSEAFAEEKTDSSDEKNAIVELTPEFIKAIEIYDQLETFSEGYAAVRKGEKWGYINTKGEEVIPCVYENAEVFHNGIAHVKKNGRCGLINTKGKEVLPCIYEYVGSFKEGLLAVKKEGKCGYLNIIGEEVIPCKFDEAGDFSEGLAVISKKVGEYETKKGYVNTKGEIVVSYVFDDAEDFHEGLAAVRKNGKQGYVNSKGEMIIQFREDVAHAGSFSEGLAFIIKDDYEHFSVIDKQGKKVFGGEVNGYSYSSLYSLLFCNYPEYHDGVIYVGNSNDEFDVYDKRGKKLKTAEYLPGYYAYSIDPKDGQEMYQSEAKKMTGAQSLPMLPVGIKNNGSFIIPAQYDYIDERFSNGVFLVQLCEYIGESGMNNDVIYYGYADLKGNDTFNKDLRKRCKALRENERVKREEEITEYETSQSSSVSSSRNVDITIQFLLYWTDGVFHTPTFKNDGGSLRICSGGRMASEYYLGTETFVIPEGKTYMFVGAEYESENNNASLNGIYFDNLNDNKGRIEINVNSGQAIILMPGRYSFVVSVNYFDDNPARCKETLHFIEKDL